MSKVLAKRYAKALVESIKEKGEDFEKALEELKLIKEFLQKNPKLYRFLRQPVIPRDDKVQMGKAFLDDLKISERIRNFLLLLIEKERIPLLDAIMDESRYIMDEVLGQVRGKVKSARPLTEEEIKDLRKSFEEVIGKKVVLEVEVDPSLIGGVVTLLEGIAFDGSVKGNLEQIKEKLMEG